MNKFLKTFLFVCLLIFLNSCKNESEKNESEEMLESSKVDTLKMANNEEFKNLTVDFFSWYKSNQNRLNKIEYLKGGYVNELDSTAYFIDENKLTEYVEEIDKSGFVSQSYVKRLKTHLEFVTNELKDEKIYEGVISGLDYDLITKSQDDEAIFLNISKIKLLKQKVVSKDDIENYYELIPNTLFLKISFTFEDKWKIEDYEFEYKIE